MTPLQVQMVLAIISLALEYGVPAVTAVFATLNKEEVTLEDIQGLRDLVKPPETY
jgi:hypothetical protein